jgi:Tfp pilus assembly protein PilE
MRSASAYRNGITLLELLVVISMLVLLLCLLLPGLSEARKQARRMPCAYNLRRLGNALTLYHSLNRRYPQRYSPNPWEPEPPPEFIKLDNITSKVAEELIATGAAEAKDFYCPSSVQNDPHARTINHLQYGEISYIYLVGVTFDFPDVHGRPTFDPEVEAPDSRRNPNAVLIGDRVVEWDEELGNPPPRGYLPGSNHGKEGGWFYFVGGYAQWITYDQLATHPRFSRGTARVWYWPKTKHQTDSTL